MNILREKFQALHMRLIGDNTYEDGLIPFGENDLHEGMSFGTPDEVDLPEGMSYETPDILNRQPEPLDCPFRKSRLGL